MITPLSTTCRLLFFLLLVPFLSFGQDHSVVVHPDGTLWAWGRNDYGQLGDGTNVHKAEPTRIGTDSDWQSVSIGQGHVVALKTDGSLWAWGINGGGQLGDGTRTTRWVPTRIGTSTDWKSISAGSMHTMALKKDGSLWGWGFQFYGRLGNGVVVNTYQLVPMRIGTDNDWKEVWARNSSTMAIRQDGSLWTWGLSNSSDDIISKFNKFPIRIGTANNWQSVSEGEGYTVGLQTDGSLWAWGMNMHGEFGDTTLRYSDEPTRIGNATNWKTVDAGSTFVAAIRQDGTLWVWGFMPASGWDTGKEYNNIPSLGWTPSEDFIKLPPTQIGKATNWQSVEAFTSHLLATRTDGAIWGWGVNQYGQVGSPTLQPSLFLTPQLLEPTATWQSVSARETVSAGVRQNGTLWTWGQTGVCKTEPGKYFAREKATQVSAATTWQSVSTGGSNIMALQADGSLWGLGNNYSSVLGLGPNQGNACSPTRVGTDTDWQQIQCGDWRTMALKKDGSLWNWGQVREEGVPTIVTTPTQTGHDTDWASIRISTHTMALKKDGSLWAWGNNENGQLGVSTSPSYPIRKEPTRVGTDSDWAQISIGNSYSLALKTDGSLWAWGLNGGWLGDGTRTTRWVPTRIGTDTDWKSISVGQSHVVALKTDGSLWAWGKNEYGQLGDGTTTTRLVPTRIGTDNNWEMASAGAYHTLALRQDGKLWGWGQNFFYQLSYGPKPEYSVEPLLIFKPAQLMQTADELELWPNPATDQVQLRTTATQPAMLRLLSPMGGLVREVALPAGPQQVTLPTAGLARGLYWIQLVQPSGHVAQPLLLR